SGGVLPAVKLTLTNQATGQERQVMTDNDGNYLASTLPIGEIHAQSGTSRVQSAVPTGDRFASRETGQSRSRYGSRQRERRSYRPGVWSAVANGKCRSKRGNRQRPRQLTALERPPVRGSHASQRQRICSATRNTRIGTRSDGSGRTRCR